MASCAVRAGRASGVLGVGLALAPIRRMDACYGMEFVGIKACDENASDSDLAELPSVRNAGIVVVGSVDDHIQCAAQ